MPAKMATSDPRTPFGTPEMPRAGPVSGLGFQAIQKIATIHTNSGVIWGIPVKMGIRTIIRPFVPAYFRQKARDFRDRRERKAWRDVNLRCDLSGTTLQILSLSDWSVFKEIFVERIYDRAISPVLSGSPQEKPVRVLDLGANVGFFSMRVAQIIFETDPSRSFFIQCVEGSPAVYKQLTNRMAANARLKEHVEVHNGLVGHRSGSAEIYESLFGAGNTIIPQHWSRPIRVPYLDLNSIVRGDEEIALLKCDIEGSEQDFQDNYGGLLKRSQHAIVEVHHDYISADKFNVGMTGLGFQHNELLWTVMSRGRVQATVVFYRR